jgi:hypothetical protein
MSESAALVTDWYDGVHKGRNSGRRVGLLTRKHVRVHVQRERRGRVTEPLGHDLDVHTGCEQMGGMTVSQVMETNAR